MNDLPPVNLGLCFSERQLYYALNGATGDFSIQRIGKIDFNFDVNTAIISRDPENYPGITDSIDKLVKEFQVTNLRCMNPAIQECWSTLPKTIYDQPTEREAYLKILMHGVSRQALEPFWFELNNRDFRFLTVRNKLTVEGYRQLGDACPFSDVCSEFELGINWIAKSRVKETFKLVGCYRDYISIASFQMGKLRAATYIKFRYIDDLPYLWLQQAENLPWLNGLHDMVYFYGPNTVPVTDMINSFLDNTVPNVRLETLAEMFVSAPEDTYGFSLEEAFPAIVLAL